MYAMQYGHSLECLTREFVIANPSLGLMYVLKEFFSDGFYHIGLHPTGAPNLVLVFPLERGDHELVMILLTLPIG